MAWKHCVLHHLRAQTNKTGIHTFKKKQKKTNTLLCTNVCSTAYTVVLYFYCDVCFQRGEEVASVGRWLARAPHISQRVPNYRRGLGLLRLHRTRRQVQLYGRLLCQIRRRRGHVHHLQKAEESVSETTKERSFYVQFSKTWRNAVSDFLLFDPTDTTCRTTSVRISTRPSTTGWRPSARRGSSWVETNPTWQIWWGNTPVSLCRL